MGTSSKVSGLYYTFSPVTATVQLWTKHSNESASTFAPCSQLTSLSAAETLLVKCLVVWGSYVSKCSCMCVCLSGYQAAAQESLMARGHSCSKRGALQLCSTWYTHMNDGPWSTQVQGNSRGDKFSPFSSSFSSSEDQQRVIVSDALYLLLCYMNCISEGEYWFFFQYCMCCENTFCVCVI